MYLTAHSILLTHVLDRSLNTPNTHVLDLTHMYLTAHVPGLVHELHTNCMVQISPLNEMMRSCNPCTRPPREILQGGTRLHLRPQGQIETSLKI